MAYLVGLERCPKCGGAMSSPIRSFRSPNTHVQTCRNVVCLHTTRTVVAPAEESRPRPVSLPIEPPAPAPQPRSAIDLFERAYERGETRKAIARQRRQLRETSANDARQKQLGSADR